jgi:hypothetical protein
MIVSHESNFSIKYFLRRTFTIFPENATFDTSHHTHTHVCFVSDLRSCLQMERILPRKQGDQMRFWKSRPKCSPIHFLWKLLHIHYRRKSSPIILATYVVFTKTTQRKQSPNIRKFAQFGHPARLGSLSKEESGFSNKFGNLNTDFFHRFFFSCKGHNVNFCRS